LAPRWLFARWLAVNLGLALVLIFISLAVGMAGEPKSAGGKLFAGLYALYSGLLLIGVTGLILAPLFHRVMHHFHLPDDDKSSGGAPKRSKNPQRK
jgi:hypothetical protein